MGLSDLVTPVSSPDGNEVELGMDDSSLDGSLHFLGTLPAESDVSIVVSEADVGLKACTLSGSGLLLHGEDGEGLLLQLVLEEVINDLELLDGDRESEDGLDVLDLTGLDKAAEFGKGNPGLITSTARATGSTSSVLIGRLAVLVLATSTAESTSEGL